MSNKKWIKKNPSFTTIEEVIEYNTGLTIAELQNPQQNPFLKGLAECVAVVKECIAQGMDIRIIGDYDVDGVAASTITALGIEEATGERPEVIIPKRFSEGYGLNMSIVDRIDDGLIITVDNGITAVEQIKKAKEKGLIVVVIDHHIIRDDGLIPPADAILDPCAIEGSEYNDYCGAGLAYRFIMELNPNTRMQKKLVSLAGIATVADVMQLKGDNRRLVIESLDAVKNADVTFGLYSLLQAIGIPINPVAMDYGFKVGPCINASGRLNDDGGEQVYNLLVKDCEVGTYKMLEMEDICKKEAEKLVNYNIQRQQMVYETMKNVYSDLANKEIKAPIVYYKEGLHEGIVGIIAGKLAEKYHMPAIVLTNTHKEGIIKGSGRSVPEVHLKKLLNNVSDMFIKWGGHGGAAGMSLELTKLEDLRDKLEKLLENVPLEPSDNVYYDLEINEKDIPEMAEKLKLYEPYGEGCPKVRFKLINFTASPRGGSHYQIMGALRNHLKIHGNRISLMGFELVDDYFDAGEPMKMDIIGELGINYFNGNVAYHMEIVDFKVRETEKTDTYNELASLFSYI